MYQFNRQKSIEASMVMCLISKHNILYFLNWPSHKTVLKFQWQMGWFVTVRVEKKSDSEPISFLAYYFGGGVWYLI